MKLTRGSAAEKYITRRASALQALTEIQKVLRDTKVSNPNWANVGDIADIDETLRNLLDRINQTGEYAK